MDGAVLTVGHSNHPLENFLALLRRHAATAVADVRSAPYSRFNPQFNRQALSQALADQELDYIYLGRELGGRADRQCYENGRIRYDWVAETPRFAEGLERLSSERAKHRIALLCAEREPLHCHRALLIAPALQQHGAEVHHIHADGQIETHAAAMDRLLDLHGLQTEDDLFAQSRTESVALALRRQAQRVGHMLPNHERVGRGKPRAQ